MEFKSEMTSQPESGQLHRRAVILVIQQIFCKTFDQPKDRLS